MMSYSFCNWKYGTVTFHPTISYNYSNRFIAIYADRGRVRERIFTKRNIMEEPTEHQHIDFIPACIASPYLFRLKRSLDLSDVNN